MGIKVCKFGGTSLADAAQIRKVAAIVQADPDRRYVVPSAPGRRSPDDRKITDLLYLCHAHAQQSVPFDDVFALIADRYRQIITQLELAMDIEPHLDRARQEIASGASADHAASRGEYLNAHIIAQLLGYTFIDPVEIIHFDAAGRFDAERTQQSVSQRLGEVERAVIPGFYGGTPDGAVKTFSRGGSDVTGAIVARGAGAEVYENWTDVSGLLMADPRVVDNPKTINTITYRELRELAYMGASVLHDEAIFPVRAAGIPVNIRNTNRPEDHGTMIVAEAQPMTCLGAISGIAGRKDFTILAIEKALMNQELGFGRRLLTVLEANGISFEHMPSGIDTMSVVVADAQLEGKLDRVLDEIRRECRPDMIKAYPHMALVATVGRGMAHTPGSAAKLFTALADASVNIRMIDQGSSEINIIVGVETADFEKAVRAIYQAFVG
jgi:aspartate kinase